MSSPKRLSLMSPTSRHSGAAGLSVVRTLSLAAILVAALAVTLAHADLPPFLQHAIASTPIEAALYRLMATPAVQALYPRPPREAEGEVTTLLAAKPGDAHLLELRARVEEQALDFTAAEADWKAAAAHAADPAAGQLTLADYEHRRLNVPAEIAALTAAGNAPTADRERSSAASSQQAWKTYQRLTTLIGSQRLSPAVEDAAWSGFLARYPAEPQVYTDYLHLLLARPDYAAAAGLIARYRQAFPQDPDFPLTASAQVARRRGDTNEAIAIYDRAFNPLWSDDLIRDFYALLAETHRAHSFLADAQARLARNPDDLNALARIFYFYQQPEAAATTNTTVAPPESQPRSLTLALQALDRFRIAKEEREGAWSPLDLYTLAHLSQLGGSASEQARYDYALASEPGTLSGTEPAAQAGLAALIAVLLSAPDQPFAVSTQNLSLYRDIATLDRGPGYWNGILSLWLNGTDPAGAYASESAQAQPYFHRARAAELLAELDRRFPGAPERSRLHAELIQAQAEYGDDAVLVASAKQFLADFPQAPQRVSVTETLANAYARQKDTAAEFALYDSELAKLAAEAGGNPLRNLNVQGAPDAHQAAASAYRQLFGIYLGQLTSNGRIPQALALLRRQLDANPNDPAAYEQLAGFLEQNNLSSEQEQLYTQAIARFNDPAGENPWYDRLARLYLKQKRSADYAALTRKVTDVFSGAEVDVWFRQVDSSRGQLGSQLALQLDVYAEKRFPHDLIFTENLLNAYSAKATADPAAYEALLRRHWWESPALTDRFFELLSRTGKLRAELADLQPLATEADPAATRELAEGSIWRSDFERAAPLMGSLAGLYPADAEVGDRAVSLFRSLAYVDPTPKSTERAAAIETSLLAAYPNSPARLETLGDLYAEATATGGEDLQTAAPYWRRIPSLTPGAPAGYLTAATVFWDYFQFDDALAEIDAARTRFARPTLFGYELGAIDESRHDLPAAVKEYTATVLAEPPPATLESGADPSANAARADGATYNADEPDAAPKEPAHTRLLQLAHRPATAALVDQATAAAVDATPTATALSLRADVLVAQNRPAEIAPMLDRALTRVATPKAAAALGALAQAHSLTPVYERALSRQVALAQDPVEQIRLQLALARSYEDRNDLPDANRTIASVYQANPRLLGVVRATVDFDDRTHQPVRAVATLLEAAQAATPQLADSFTLEAAQTANAAGNTAQARSLGTGLLAKAPYDGRYLAVVAESYARANDNAGLRDVYAAKLTAVKADSTLTPGTRKQTTALLRRGLIPALARLGDNAGAIDQYIALLSAYPEDAGTAQQAALFALAHGREAQLVGFLQTTVHDSPRDSRFAILLAQVETTFDEPAAALAAYSQAIAIRKDRVDLYSARADLELRLDQPDAAADDYARLYQLSYRDSDWMVRLGELRARQGRPQDAVKALVTAYVDGRPVAPSNRFNVARDLERWNLLAEARTFAAEGVRLAGPDLLVAPLTAAPAEADEAGDEDTSPTNADGATGATSTPFSQPNSPNASGAALYARILTRLGQPDQALGTLTAARRSALAASPGSIAAALAGVKLDPKDKASTASDLRRLRAATIDASFQAAVLEMSNTVRTYATPEGKQRYAILLDGARAADGSTTAWIAAARAAGLADREADWLRAALLGPGDAAQYLSPYTTLQQSRMRFAELAGTLEAYAAQLKPAARAGTLVQAAEAYRTAGDTADELRLERRITAGDDAALRDRFLHLLLSRDPNALTALAADQNASWADAAADFALAQASPQQAFAAIDARGSSLGPLWRNATTALAGLYLASDPVMRAPEQAHRVDTAFRVTLNVDATIGQRLGAKPDPAAALTGDLWFPYGAGYGVLRETLPNLGDPEDFAAASLEGSPGAVAPYLQLARTYAEAGRPDAAYTEFDHARELSEQEPVETAAIDDEQAALELGMGRTAEAIAHWRAALERLTYLAERNAYPEPFWPVFTSVAGHLGVSHLEPQLRPEIERVLRAYLQHNGNYRSDDLLRAAYQASPSPADGVMLILASAAGVPEEAAVLDNLNAAAWITPAGRARLLLRRMELARSGSLTENGASPGQLPSLQFSLARLYLDQNDLPGAEKLVHFMTKPAVSGANEIPHGEAVGVYQASDAYVSLRIEIAVRTGQLAPLASTWAAQPEPTPNDATLDDALRTLRLRTAAYTPDSQQIRPLAEFVFERKRLEDALQATDYLSVAETRLNTGDLPGALEVLHRLSLLPDEEASFPSRVRYISPIGDVTADDLTAAPPVDLTSNLDSAARLLETTHHLPEAVPFLASLVRATPWNAGYRLRLAEAQLASPDRRAEAAANLQTVARDALAPYATRLKAARQLRLAGAPAADLGSGELNLVAAVKPPAAGAAGQPCFSAARVYAAAGDPSAAPQLLAEAVGAAPAGPAAAQARLHLLQIELAAGHAASALAVVESAAALATNASSYAYNRSPEQGSDLEPPLNLPPFAAGLPQPERLRLAEQLAAAYEQTDQPSVALSSLELVRQAAPQPAPALLAHIAALKSRLELDRRNRARRPAIHSTLEQTGQDADAGSGSSVPRSRPVRPRLLSLGSQPVASGLDGGSQ